MTRVWVIEKLPYGCKRWEPTNTHHLRPAVYFSRAEARRAIHNLEVNGRVRIRQYARKEAK